MSAIIPNLKPALLRALFLLAVMYALHALTVMEDWNLGFMGIAPREWWSLPGILSAPLIHGDWKHLFSNTLPLLVLLTGIQVFYPRVALRAVTMIWLLTGLWVWIAGHSGIHIGASGLVYGLAAFGFFYGVFRRDAASSLVSLAVVFYYGGMVWGIFPGQTGISWESHLFGAIAGLLAAWRFRKVDLVKKTYSWENEPEPEYPSGGAWWDYPQQQNVREIEIRHRED